MSKASTIILLIFAVFMTVDACGDYIPHLISAKSDDKVLLGFVLAAAIFLGWLFVLFELGTGKIKRPWEDD